MRKYIIIVTIVTATILSGCFATKAVVVRDTYAEESMEKSKALAENHKKREEAYLAELIGYKLAFAEMRSGTRKTLIEKITDRQKAIEQTWAASKSYRDELEEIKSAANWELTQINDDYSSGITLSGSPTDVNSMANNEDKAAKDFVMKSGGQVVELVATIWNKSQEHKAKIQEQLDPAKSMSTKIIDKKPVSNDGGAFQSPAPVQPVK